MKEHSLFRQQRSITTTERLLNKRYTPLYVLLICYLCISLLLRIVLLLSFGPAAHVSILQFPAIIGLGLVNDLAVAFYLLTPFALYLLLTPRHLYNSATGRFLMLAFLWIFLFGILYLAAVQFFFFLEFDSRFNLVAVDYLIYPHEVFVNIWQSYPVGRVLLVMAFISSSTLFFIWPVIRSTMDMQTTLRNRAPVFCTILLLCTASLLVLSTDTLGYSPNRVAKELTANGISSFFQAFRTNQLDYKQYYRNKDSLEMFSLLRKKLLDNGGTFISKQPENISRRFSGKTDGLGKLNVVVIVEESLGCEHMDACGKGLNIDSAMAEQPYQMTPFLDAFARQGLFFNRAYATGTRTVRGLEAISASFPPIPSESIMKRPGGDDIATWGKVMRENGYQTSFLYGGYGQFDNMNPFFRGNGFAISDRLDIKNPIFTNIWGVSDQDLFRHACSYFDDLSQQGKPFFSLIMSTSNHSPYTFPAGIPGVIPKGGGRNEGVIYADYSLASFFARARQHSWYADTLFVIVADHGARVYGEAQIPIASYEIPLLIIAPGRISPKQIQTPISQIDIAPTVLGLLGLPYQAPFLGRDVLAENSTPATLLFNHNHDVALYTDGKLVVLGLRNQVNTYQYTLGSETFRKIADIPELTDLATAYYQCSFELFTEKHYQ